ncbi:MAG: ComEC/Rec2 family competence protein, partial [Ruegeria sp.]|nr:ComEC/Rec2 family competence protein [Ruegeria sp.]
MMGAIVVPTAFVAALLAPFRLEAIALHVMGLGLEWILAVSEKVSGLNGAQGYVVSPPHYVLPMFALGALWLALWRGRAKWIGIAPVAAAFFLWGQGHRPDVLIADSGGLVGVMTESGRALSKEKGSGFIASVWLENDGDGVNQVKAASRWPDSSGAIRRYVWQGKELVHITGKRAAQGFEECRENQIVVSAVDLNLSGECGHFDPGRLKHTGSLALTGDRITTSRETIGHRLWSPDEGGSRDFKRVQ